jgi:anhydro-N-acetylmuramic acid kinase
MSGTALDGVDAAWIESDGDRFTAFGPSLTLAYPSDLREELRALVHAPARAETDPLSALEARLTEVNAEAVETLLAQTGQRPDVVGFHGQTILHRPERGYTRQLGDGQRLATQLGLAVVNRFRHADLAAGGQGAPLVPVFHAALAQDLPKPWVVLNLGGVGNLTYIGDETLLAFDTGPGNALIDDWVTRHTNQTWDAGGRLAARGRVDAKALARLLDHPYFAAPPPKSLDRNGWAIEAVAGLSAEDGAATLTEFTAQTIAATLPHLPSRPTRWLVTGGGRHNAHLMARIAVSVAAPAVPVETLGWDGDALEAQAFGFLAIRAVQGRVLSLPSTTGAAYPVSGGVLHRPNKPS